MGVVLTYGTIGSGKTYSMICRILDDLQDGKRVATINVNLKTANVQGELVRRGLPVFEARRRAGSVEQVFTLARFRELRDAHLYVDEAHFWWPQNQYKKIDFEDILTAAMSRKRRLDIDIVSQLDGSVNQNVRGLAMESWLARPVVALTDVLKLSRKLLRLPVPPALFEYIRMESFEGGPQRRKDGSIAASDKRFLWLRPSIAACYDTLQEISSPTLDELRDNSRQQRLLSILKGETRPQSVCQLCEGQRDVKLLRIPVEASDGSVSAELVPWDADTLRRNFWAREWSGECPACEGRGYVYDPEHPDYAAASALVDELEKVRGGGERGRRRSA